DASAVGVLGAAEQIDDAALGLKLVKEQAHALQVIDRLEVLQQMRGAAHDQLALIALAARPAREAGRDDLLGERVELPLLPIERPAAATFASMAWRSSAEMSPISIRASMKKRSPSSVGSRPAEVCGA